MKVVIDVNDIIVKKNILYIVAVFLTIKLKLIFDFVQFALVIFSCSEYHDVIVVNFEGLIVQVLELKINGMKMLRNV